MTREEAILAMAEYVRDICSWSSAESERWGQIIAALAPAPAPRRCLQHMPPWDNDFGPCYEPSDDEVARWRAWVCPECGWRPVPTLPPRTGCSGRSPTRPRGGSRSLGNRVEEEDR